jgi:RNA polymerase sigma factor (TIGR02999 family)
MALEGRRTTEEGAVGDITGLLSEWTANRPETAPEIWSEVYRELRQIARAYMRNERPDHTLQTTALVNEAYLRLFQGKPGRWENRKHFFCTMAQAMRRVLVDHARECHAQKRGGEWEKLSIDAARLLAENGTEQLLALNQALERLGSLNRRQAQVVELRFFAGLTSEETAAMLDISPETVKLDWRFARAWLQRQLRPGEHLDGDT